MTYYEKDCGGGEGGGEVVPELTPRNGGEDDKGDYVKLRQRPDEYLAEEEGLCEVVVEPEPEPKHFSPFRGCGSLWIWAKFVVVSVFIGLFALVFIKWVAPFFMDKEIIPIINWELSTFSIPQLAFLVFGSVALFPSILLPSSPSMWLAGMTFGYGFGFLLIFSGVIVGVSLPYFIGSLFHHKIQGCLEKYPKKASILRLAGEGNWFHQFRAVTLIRVSPFPYIIYNYCAVATNVKYGPYIMGSMAGMIPEIFAAIYTGILIKTLADASHDRHSLSAPQIVFTVVGFCVTAGTTVFFTIYAKRQLDNLKKEDEQLLC